MSGATARAGLLPQEVHRRHQAVMNAYWNSRAATPADDAGLAAGFSPAGTAKPPRKPQNFPPAQRLCKGTCEAVPADFSQRPGVRLVVSYDFARRWAVGNGLCHRRNAMDLKVVNAARREMGLVLFVLKGPA